MMTGCIQRDSEDFEKKSDMVPKSQPFHEWREAIMLRFRTG